VTVESDLESRPDRKGDGPLRVKRIVIENAAGESVASMLVGLPATIKFQYDSGGSEVRNADIRVWLENLYGQRLCAMSTHLTGQQFTSLPEAGEIVCQMPRLPVAPGLYTLTYVIEAKGRTVDKMYGAVSFEVIAADFYGSGRTLEHAGSFLIDHCWSVK
jgi:lipopolysaccharide transport system ATP-binding protein